MDDQATYAPRSPDLSAIQAQQHPSSFYHPHPQSARPSHREPLPLPSSANPSYGWDQTASPGAYQSPDPNRPYPFSHPLPASQSALNQQSAAWNTYASPPHLPPMALAAQEEERKPAPGELEGIVVRTKFPVARIKRIVQADEDVGKVAQVTPVVVSKALEMFMISLALKSAAEAKRTSSKRITSQHLKMAVAKDEHFDFLSDHMDKISDNPGSREKKPVKGESDDSDFDMESSKKKRGPGRRRKREDS